MTGQGGGDFVTRIHFNSYASLFADEIPEPEDADIHDEDSSHNSKNKSKHRALPENHFLSGGIGHVLADSRFDEIKLFLDLDNVTECRTIVWL